MMMIRTALALVLVMFWAAVAQADYIGASDREVQAVANPILDSLLAGFNEGDYAKYSRDFDDTLKEALPENKFQQVRSEIQKKLGAYQSRTYLGFLQQNRFTVILWKGKFSQNPGDVLIKLVASKRQNKVVVVGLWFQ